ncbi:hypothetical protein CHARACLAT_025743 [Characodon lateralis]|uniref:DM14 domain-containing protein n=1 Tax=Characodon lateralis TaxID=208331 RepID=A0ABU7F6F9_9TELE|nr:hypothetical protein [Characodon lateralis]
MFGKKKKAPMPKGQGTAAAKKMGLFVDLDPEKMLMGAEENLDDPDLEAELAAITGNKANTRGRVKPKGKSPLPMEDIAKMADECMRDVDEDDDDNVEDDEDLLAELQEVVGEEEAGDAETASSTFSASAESSQVEAVESSAAQGVKVSKAAPGSLQNTLEERAEMYRTAIKNAKTAGETSKARRYDRGLKSLESMLAAVKKGKPVNESEIPPPVATGDPVAASQPAVPARPAPPVPSRPDGAQQGETEATTLPTAVSDAMTLSSEEEQSSSATIPTLSNLPSPEEPPVGTADLTKASLTDSMTEGTKTMLLERQKEYKLAALRAKKEGDLEQAKLYFKTSKVS